MSTKQNEIMKNKKLKINKKENFKLHTNFI
jgi:hypothetical protein